MTARPVLVLFSCAVLGLAACGGDDEEGSADNTRGYSGSGPVASVQEYLDAFVDGDFEKACGYIASESKEQIEKAGSCADVLEKASEAVEGTDASMEGAKAAPGSIEGKSGEVKVTTKGGLEIKIPVLIEDDRWKVNRGGA